MNVTKTVVYTIEKGTRQATLCYHTVCYAIYEGSKPRKCTTTCNYTYKQYTAYRANLT